MRMMFLGGVGALDAVPAGIRLPDLLQLGSGLGLVSGAEAGGGGVRHGVSFDAVPVAVTAPEVLTSTLREEVHATMTNQERSFIEFLFL